MNIELQSMAIEMPPVAAHPNRAPFRGVLTLVDTASDSSPSGAKGHRVLLTRSSCEAALPSLLGMGLDYAPMLDAHDAQRKIGVITEANIIASRQLPVVSNGTSNRQPATDNCIAIAGFLYARDFPRIMRTLRAQHPAAGGRGTHLYGMSYEITDARVADMLAPVWIVTDFTFTGAAVLRRDKAAYRNTWFELIG
jgi:hypothetical protein